MAGLTVRKAVPGDAAVIAGFNRALALETEALELDPDTILAGVSRLLANPELGFYVVAETGGEIAGCLMITFEWSDWRNGMIWWLQSVYVSPPFRRQGVFKTLYGHVRDMAARDSGIAGFRLYVEKDNTAAQRTYADQGLQPTHYLMFEDLK